MSTYAIYGEIEFPVIRDRGKITVRKFSSVKIESSWQNLTDISMIVLPRKTKDFDRFAVGDVFQAGDPVVIRTGYNGELYAEFEGYISQVSTYVPVIITCEDEMYNLKRKSISFSRSSCTLRELLQAVAVGYEIQCDDMTIGSVRYSNKLVTEIFDDLKNKMNLYTYFRGKTLVCGRTSIDRGKYVDIIIERQAEDSLKDKPVGQILVKVESIQSYTGKKKTKKITAIKGEKNGNTITIKQPNLTQQEVDKIAIEVYEKAKQPGLDGELTLFGVPRTRHGMIANISSVLYPERNGSYYIDSVVKTIEKGRGYRQVIKLGGKAA